MIYNTSLRWELLLTRYYVSFQTFPAHNPCTKLWNIYHLHCSLLGQIMISPKHCYLIIVSYYNDNNPTYNPKTDHFQTDFYINFFYQKVVLLTVNDRRYCKIKRSWQCKDDFAKLSSKEILFAPNIYTQLFLIKTQILEPHEIGQMYFKKLNILRNNN